MRRRLITILLTIRGLMLSAGAAAVTPAGTVAGVSGLCIDHGRVLATGHAVEVRDAINAPANCRLQLKLGDGSVISLAPDSSMTLAIYNVAGGRYVKLSLHKGLLRAVVTPAREPSTFEVTTSFGTASVRSGSADWFVKAQPGLSQVGVLDGTVELRSAATGRSVLIPSHWGTRLHGGFDPVLSRRWAQKEFKTVIRLTNVTGWTVPADRGGL